MIFKVRTHPVSPPSCVKLDYFQSKFGWQLNVYSLCWLWTQGESRVNVNGFMTGDRIIQKSLPNRYTFEYVIINVLTHEQ